MNSTHSLVSYPHWFPRVGSNMADSQVEKDVLPVPVAAPLPLATPEVGAGVSSLGGAPVGASVLSRTASRGRLGRAAW